MFIGWEGTGLASYALIGHWFTDQKDKWVGDEGRKVLGIPMDFSPSHSGVRALVFTRLGDVGLIAGIGVIYMLTNSLSIPAMASNVAMWGQELAVRGMLLPFMFAFTLGAMAKSAQFPFHEWLVTAMTGPTSVSALIHAATMVKAGIFFMLRFTPIIYLASRELNLIVPSAAADVRLYFTVIVYLGAFTAFLMATQAIVAKELKLVLAFSTASQLGLIFMACGASGLIADFSSGFIAAFNYLMSHAIFKASLFLAAGAVIHSVESRYMDDMGGLSKFMKVTFITMLIAALSLSGVPPLLGFWTKDHLLEIVYQTNLFVPLMLMVITIALTAFYSIRLIMKTFLTQPSERVKHMAGENELHEANPMLLAPYALLAIVTVAIGVVWIFVGGDISSALIKNALAMTEKPLSIGVELDPLLTGTSLAMVSVGVGTAYLTYGKRGSNLKIGERLAKNKVSRGIQSFLYNRWYLNSIYYKIFVQGASNLANGLFKYVDVGVVDRVYHRIIPWFAAKASSVGSKYFETGVIDRGYHRAMPRAFVLASDSIFKAFETAVIDKGYNLVVAKASLLLSNAFRRIQTGRVNDYLLLLLLGFNALLLLLLLGVI